MLSLDLVEEGAILRGEGRYQIIEGQAVNLFEVLYLFSAAVHTLTGPVEEVTAQGVVHLRFDVAKDTQKFGEFISNGYG